MIMLISRSVNDFIFQYLRKIVIDNSNIFNYNGNGVWR